MRRRWFGRDAALLCQQMGVDDPVAAVRRLAHELIDDVGFDQPPFTPEILASFRGVREVRRVAMSSAARLVPRAGALAIELNSDHSVGKQNFSVDHEVMHTALPTYTGGFVDDPETGTFSDSSEEELLCDIGAAALLLDERWLGPRALEAGPSLAALQALAAEFGASLEATARRLAELGVWSCAFVFWEEGFRVGDRVAPGQPLLPGMMGIGAPTAKLRVVAAYRSPSFAHTIPWNKSAPPTSLVHQAAQGGKMTHGFEDFDLGHRCIRLYCENLHAPYRRGGEVRSRVISILLPTPTFRPAPPASAGFQMEIL